MATMGSVAHAALAWNRHGQRAWVDAIADIDLTAIVGDALVERGD
jgi:hypothetical protein